MKTLKIVILMACAVAVMACNNNSSQAISGVYVADYQNEYTIGSDTLVLTVYNLSSGTFEIERRTGYQKIRDGKTLPKEFKKAKWTAAYDRDKMALTESEYGRKIYIKDSQNLLLGDTRYQRLK